MRILRWLFDPWIMTRAEFRAATKAYKKETKTMDTNKSFSEEEQAMKAQTHTPGPWEYGHSDPGAEPFLWIGVSDERQDEVPDLSIAVIYYGGDHFGPATFADHVERAEANARLIAAAPDLLEACKAAQSIVQQHNLQSTASEEDRLATLNRLCNWLNGPRLAAIRKAVDDDEWL